MSSRRQRIAIRNMQWNRKNSLKDITASACWPQKSDKMKNSLEYQELTAAGQGSPWENYNNE